MPVAETELSYKDPFGLLVAVILSAQCTDKRVNMVTPALLDRFPTPEALAAATFEELFPYVKSVSYPNSKTRHLIDMASKLVSDFGSEVPSDIDALMTLPGVGRKTANVIASIVYDKPVIAVDTHVFRVSHTRDRGTGSRAEHTRRRPGPLPPLAHPSRTIHLHCPCPEMRILRTRTLVQGIQVPILTRREGPSWNRWKTPHNK